MTTSRSNTSQSKSPKDNPERKAISKATKDSLERQSSMSIAIPILGQIHLPPVQDLAWYAGLGLLGASGLVDWPILGVVMTGKILSEIKGNKVVSNFGSSLEEAS